MLSYAQFVHIESPRHRARGGFYVTIGVYRSFEASWRAGALGDVAGRTRHIQTVCAHPLASWAQYVVSDGIITEVEPC